MLGGCGGAVQGAAGNVKISWYALSKISMTTTFISPPTARRTINLLLINILFTFILVN